MTLSDFITSFLSYLIMFPAAVLCFAPVWNHFRFKRSRTVITAVVLITLFAVICSFMEARLSLDFNVLYLPVIILLFIAYHKSLTLHISQSMSVFVLVVTFYSFLVNFSIIFDALRYPKRYLVDFSLSASIFQLVLCTVFSALVCYPMAKYGSFLLEHLQQALIWMVSVLISTMFFLFNLRMVIHNYSTLHTNMVGIAYFTVMPMMFILFLVLCVIFYFIVNALVKKAEIEDRNHILEMQEKQYASLQRYIEADTKARHDFRQTIYTLTELSVEKNYPAIDEYLNRYRDMLPAKDTTDFCDDHAMNALLNHYLRKAEISEIRTNLKVILPETLHIESIDLCSIVGNILENAITACLDIPKEKRFIRMVISEEQNSELYIAISNSYNGKLRKKGDRYLSTHKGGNGIGLISIAATAARYDGTTEFSHDEGVFYSGVMLVNKPTVEITS